MSETTAKILLLDIETSPLESYTWGIWDVNVGLDQIKTEWSILSYAAKWLHSPRVLYKDTGGRGKRKVRDDKVLMDDLWALLDEADIIVAQNGQRFDCKKINARLIMHGYGPPSPYRVVDTLLVSKKYFAFTSNKLGWVSKYLTDSPKSVHKKFPGFDLWLQCLEDNPAAWVEMRKYNKQDVIALEKLYLRQLPWIANHPNLTAYTDKAGYCPKCGGEVTREGVKVHISGRYQRLKCKNCGGWSRSKINVIPPPIRKATLQSA